MLHNELSLSSILNFLPDLGFFFLFTTIRAHTHLTTTQTVKHQAIPVPSLDLATPSLDPAYLHQEAKPSSKDFVPMHISFDTLNMRPSESYAGPRTSSYARCNRYKSSKARYSQLKAPGKPQWKRKMYKMSLQVRAWIKKALK